MFVRWVGTQMTEEKEQTDAYKIYKEDVSLNSNC